MASSLRKTAAGFIIFRRKTSDIEFLLLQASNGKNHWTPPKGIIHETEYLERIRDIFSLSFNGSY